MTPVTLSRFEKSARSYTYIDAYKACLSSADSNCATIERYMQGLITQMHNHADEPCGWSFAEWRKGTNVASNLVGANAILLEYAMKRDDTDLITRLHAKAQKLGWAFFMIDTETKNGNTLTVVWPLTSSVNQAQYARLASILAEEMDEYGMEHGCLAATHIINVHRQSTPIVIQGTPLDPVKEIKRTAKLYQRLNSRKYEGTRPVSKLTTPSENEPQAIEDGLFLFFETPKEKAQREALEVMARHGFAG
jgi:hypothetical protein